MKKIGFFTTLIVVMMTITHAQVPPQAFNYSAVARNASGDPISMTTIGIQISILKTSTTGSIVYSENHHLNTDSFGLFNVIIGTGSIQSGNMSHIDWGGDNYYLKVGMDIAGGTNFRTMGVTQLLSVPYALHAKTADSITGVSTFIEAGSNITISGTGTSTDPYIVSSISNPLQAATVQTGSASNIQTNSATIAGTTNANGFLSNVSFEYGETTNYGRTAIPSPSIVTGNSTVSSSVNLSGLLPGKTYHYRIKAQNAVDVSYGNAQTFTTLSLPATIESSGAWDSLHMNNSKHLILYARVNAHGLPTTITFEYGTTMSLGQSIIATPSSISSHTTTGVSADFIISTPPRTQYYYRVKAVNTEGTVYSSIATYTTTN